MGIRLLFYAAALMVIWLMLRRALVPRGRGRPMPSRERTAPVAQLVQDPQCGVYLDVQDAVRRRVGKGELFFCSEACASAFLDKKSQGL